MKSSPLRIKHSMNKALGSSFYRLKEGSPERHSFSRIEEEMSSSPYSWKQN
jgi:hypothetical protein